MSVGQKMKLNEAGVTLIDCDHKTPTAQTSGYPYVGIPQLKDGHIRLDGARLISEEDFVLWTKKAKPKHNDVILSRRCNPGESAYVPEGLEIALGQNLVLLRSDGSVIYPPFLRWLVQGNEWWKQVNKFLNVGAVFNSLKCKDIPNFNLTIPSLNEQKRITDILSSLDNKIELNNKVNQTLESIAQALFKSWFIDFDPVRAKIVAKLEGADPEIAAMCAISGKSQEELKQMSKDDFAELQASAALFPDELVETELGEVPKGWEYKKLKDLCRVINGRAYKNTEFKEEGIPIVRIQNLTGGGKIVFSDLDLPQDKLIEKEDFIYAWSATFGPYIWRGPKSIYHYHIWKMDVDETIISRYFLYLTMFRKTESMKSAGTGSIFTHLTKVIMESQDVLIADNAINMLFKDRIDKIFKLISLKSDEIKNLENIRDTLLPKLLSGEVDVTTLADTKNSSDKEQIA